MREHYNHTLINKINKFNIEFPLTPLIIQKYLTECMNEKMIYIFIPLMNVSFIKLLKSFLYENMCYHT